MKSLRRLIVFSLAIIGCAPRAGFVALEHVPAASLTDARDPVVMSEVARKSSGYRAPFDRQLAAFKLAQDAYHAAPKHPEIALTLASCAHFTAGLDDVSHTKFQVIRKGLEAARAAQSVDPNPIAAYYVGVFWGQLIQKRGLTALGKLPELEQVFRQALDNPHTDFGGPYRALGMLYLKAPAWPRSLGDLDQALEFLQRAVDESPQFPLNHFFLAQALFEDQSFDDAHHHLEIAMELIDKDEYGAYGPRWHREIADFRRKVLAEEPN